MAKLRLTSERFLQIIDSFWSVSSDITSIKTQDVVRCRCRVCGVESSKKAVRFIESIDNRTHGCLSCHTVFIKSPEFAEYQRNINLPFAAQRSEESRARMLAFYSAHPEKKKELSSALHTSEVKEKSNAAKKAFYANMSTDDKRAFFAKRKRPLRVNRNLALQGEKRRAAWARLSEDEKQKACAHLVEISKSTKMRKRRRDRAIETQLWSKGVKHNTKPEKEIREALGLDVNESGRYFKVPSSDPLHAEGRRAYEVDIYVPSVSVGIEYNGLFVHSESRRPDHFYHLKKTEFFHRQGIRLIQIWQHQWRDRREQVTTFLRSAVGLNSRRVFARKCRVEILESSVAGEFVEKYHIQGAYKKGLLFSVGIFEGDELLMVSTFGLHHRNNTEIVLNRLVSKSDVTVVGGLGRLSKFASGICKQEIVTWADRCLSEGDGYLASGWIKGDVSNPDYFYVNRNNNVVSKQSRKKSAVKTPAGMTEREHALRDGLIRCWDCGKIRFVYPHTSGVSP